jgi:hypothetical protein
VKNMSRVSATLGAKVLTEVDYKYFLCFPKELKTIALGVIGEEG